MSRQPVGALDFAVGRHSSYAGETGHDPRRFTVAHDEAEILPLLRQVKRLNPACGSSPPPRSPPAAQRLLRDRSAGAASGRRVSASWDR
ncbi:hypothetical protein [Actinocrispum sp. NPDC049592]|uniref:hypothetical protein n=1 Tax=Actinocrispum sp. NPDC049592 TaxID=3154835 RepID=UPI00342EC2B0